MRYLLAFQMDVFDAAQKYKENQNDLIVVAGKDYGSGSSRDWAAKGPWMLVKTCFTFVLRLLKLILIFFVCTKF